MDRATPASRAPRSIVPSHQVALIARATRPRSRDGMSSSIAELIAAYSPPMPVPASARKIAKLMKFHESAVASVVTIYTASVIKNSRLRPKRSVKSPKTRAPIDAPTRYASRGFTDLACGQAEPGILLQPRPDRADDRYLQSVQNPRDSRVRSRGSSANGSRVSGLSGAGYRFARIESSTERCDSRVRGA